jgi:hypothetical protein
VPFDAGALEQALCHRRFAVTAHTRAWCALEQQNAKSVNSGAQPRETRRVFLAPVFSATDCEEIKVRPAMVMRQRIRA